MQSDDELKSNVVGMKYPKKARARIPDGWVENQRCVICNAYHCLPRRISEASEELQDAGDNIMPMCTDHFPIPLWELYRATPGLRDWLMEHDRFDIMVDLDIQASIYSK